MTTKMRALAATTMLAGLVMAGNAGAFPLALTAEGIALGFTLDIVVSGLDGGTASCCNVLGSAVNSDGTILVNDAGHGTILRFSNANNQTRATALSEVSTVGFPIAMANALGSVYKGGTSLQKLNVDGTVAATYSNINVSTGLWTNPVNQHLIAVGSATTATGFISGIIDIDVSGATPTATLIANVGSDGITVAPDGKTVYTNSQAIDIATGAIIANYFVSGADGMGVITSTNALNGDVVVSTTGGQLILLDADNGFAQTVIATNGGYGDFTSPDFTTGTLLVSSGDMLLRLGCGPACGVGSGPVDPPPPSDGVPAPAMTWILGGALLALTRFRATRA